MRRNRRKQDGGGCGINFPPTERQSLQQLPKQTIIYCRLPSFQHRGIQCNGEWGAPSSWTAPEWLPKKAGNTGLCTRVPATYATNVLWRKSISRAEVCLLLTFALLLPASYFSNFCSLSNWFTGRSVLPWGKKDLLIIASPFSILAK